MAKQCRLLCVHRERLQALLGWLAQCFVCDSPGRLFSIKLTIVNPKLVSILWTFLAIWLLRSASYRLFSLDSQTVNARFPGPQQSSADKHKLSQKPAVWHEKPRTVKITRFQIHAVHFCVSAFQNLQGKITVRMLPNEKNETLGESRLVGLLWTAFGCRKQSWVLTRILENSLIEEIN